MTSSLHPISIFATLYGHNLKELVTSLERSRESLANDLASTSAQVQYLQEELDTLPVVKNNLQVHNTLLCSTFGGDFNLAV